MYEQELTLHILFQINEASLKIIKRFRSILTPDDFTDIAT